ncbi:MAG: 3'(2'), 5'-bisphosphate nucleotidase [Verrucomicrobiales bacterium]
MVNPPSDHELAHRFAAATADLLVDVQQEGLANGDLRSSLEQSGDVAAHDLLISDIGEHRPDDGLLSEEGHDDGARVAKARSWIVDPLDGSSGFGIGNAEWAVHVALSISGEALVGAVAVPGMGWTASTLEVPIVPDRGSRRPVVVTGRSRSWSDGELLAEALDADLIACSSAGVKAMMVMAGDADVYVHDGPLYEWDVCAPVAVALAAGLHATDSRGEALVFNKERPVVDSLVICRPEFTAHVIQTLNGRNRP